MVDKKDIIDVDSLEMIEEVHQRLDALLELLEEKGLINEAQYAKKLEEVFSREDEQSH